MEAMGGGLRLDSSPRTKEGEREREREKEREDESARRTDHLSKAERCTHKARPGAIT